MKNVTELRDELASVFTDLRNGDVEAKTVAELANVAGKMINTMKVEMEYIQMTKSERKIKFLE